MVSLKMRDFQIIRLIGYCSFLTRGNQGPFEIPLITMHSKYLIGTIVTTDINENHPVFHGNPQVFPSFSWKSPGFPMVWGDIPSPRGCPRAVRQGLTLAAQLHQGRRQLGAGFGGQILDFRSWDNHRIIAGLKKLAQKVII